MKSHRPDKMASVIREIVVAMITDKLQDPRISRFTSVTRVEVSGDLQNAKVFISVMGSEAEERSTMRGLDHARGLIQRAVARGVSIRICPHLRFVVDGSLKKAQEILRIIDANAAERPADQLEGDPVAVRPEDDLDDEFAARETDEEIDAFEPDGDEDRLSDGVGG